MWPRKKVTPGQGCTVEPGWELTIQLGTVLRGSWEVSRIGGYL